MKQLISSSNLFVMQVEMDVYTALKKVLSTGTDRGSVKLNSWVVVGLSHNEDFNLLGVYWKYLMPHQNLCGD